MRELSTEILLLILCGIVILSYVFSILSRHVRIPSVLMLLFTGVICKAIADYNHFQVSLPASLTEGLGVVGLIMIVLEAGLDLQLSKAKMGLIRSSFFSALIILIFSVALITTILHFWLYEAFERCIVYAIPLSIMSSSIVLPSIHHLTDNKKEFLIYEASFSDILGLLLFNYFTAREILTLLSFATFASNVIVAAVLSLLLSVALLFVLARTKMNIRFFLIFALLILIYETGKMAGLPSLLMILVFGLLINNWEQIRIPRFLKLFREEHVKTLRILLHSITAESSFLIRTFFFILFGFGMQLNFLRETDVVIVGSLIVVSLFLIRFLYFRFFLHTNIFPEVFFIPRGLITIVLFYKIPGNFRLGSFNEGILFFIILTSSLIMAIGMLFYKKNAAQIVEDPQFTDQSSSYEPESL